MNVITYTARIFDIDSDDTAPVHITENVSAELAAAQLVTLQALGGNHQIIFQRLLNGAAWLNANGVCRMARQVSDTESLADVAADLAEMFSEDQRDANRAWHGLV